MVPDGRARSDARQYASTPIITILFCSLYIYMVKLPTDQSSRAILHN
jgi:hypothetical protein